MALMKPKPPLVPGSVDYIVTPDEVIHCTSRRRPRGLVWQDLTAEKIAAIPAPAARHAAHGRA